MHGLQIKPRWQAAISKERRSFTAFFQPIFPELASFHWVYPDTIPFAGSDAEFQELVETTCSVGHIPPGSLLPRFADFITDDWADLYGFQASPDVAAVRQRLRGSPTDYEWLSRHTDICFFNVDGAWWEIYARDDSLLGTVRRHATGLPDVTLHERLLAQRDILA